MTEAQWQGPTSNKAAETYRSYLRIVSHPAFRIGFLDAQCDHPLDHDNIIDRIRAETPATALRRLGWDNDIFSRDDVEAAQYRYEEGRLAVLALGLRCKAWGHPDYPPAAIRQYIDARIAGTALSLRDTLALVSPPSGAE